MFVAASQEQDSRRRHQNGNSAYYLGSGWGNNNKNNGYAVVPFFASRCFRWRLTITRKMTEHVTIEEVYLAYWDCRRRKRGTEGALRFEVEMEAECHRLWEELNAGTYEVGRSIAFCVTRPKLREVFAASFRDRVVHHLIARRWGMAMEERLTPRAYACRRGFGTLYAIKDVERQCREVTDGYTREAWALKCDIKAFFMHIDRNVLYGLLSEVITDEWWLGLTAKVLFNRPEKDCEIRGDTGLWGRLPRDKSLFHSDGKGLPIGNLTSQMFANLYMAEFDLWAMQRCQGYGRYVDDFVCIDTDKGRLLALLDGARKWLKDNRGLTLHPRKISLQRVRHGVSLAGATVRPWGTYVGKRTAKGLQRAADAPRDDIRAWLSRVNSYYGLCRHHLTYGMRRGAWERITDKRGLVCVNMNHIKQTRL